MAQEPNTNTTLDKAWEDEGGGKRRMEDTMIPHEGSQRRRVDGMEA